MDENCTDNPWAVPDIMVFNYFLCPECNFQAKTSPLFEDHATENHPRAKRLFDNQIKSEQETLEDILKSEKGEDTDSYAIFDIGLGDNEDEEGMNYFWPFLAILTILAILGYFGLFWALLGSFLLFLVIFDIGLGDGEDEEGTKNIIYPAMFCLFKAKFSPKN